MDEYERGDAIPEERRQFKQLLLQNPNYFGNLADSTFEAINPISGNTSFEQLACVGLNPAYDRLEAVVEIKRDSGYGGEICEDGTFEFVRFFVDLYDNGVWHDVGVADVRVHDIPGPKPLCYAVHLDFSSYRKFCTQENIVKVRAVLQWNAPPSSNPNHPPVWGNVLDAQVQIRPRYFIDWGDISDELDVLEIEIPDPVGPVVKLIDPSQQLLVSKAQPLLFADKKQLYAQHDVPLHRFGFQEAQQLMTLADPSVLAAGSKTMTSSLGLQAAEISELLELIKVTDGNTTYEELRCIGLEPEAGLLQGVITVKKPSGFSGPLCGAGSTEYVAFWIDFGDGTGFEYMGTSTLNVHDLQTIPDEDVQYAVFLPHDLSKYQIPCEAGPRVVRMRAILSWETAPPPHNPNWVPTWGNREECLIQLNPGELEGHVGLIEAVSGVTVNDIEANGKTEMPGDRPFGGTITLTGRIGNPPDSFTSGAPSFKYRIEVFGPAPYDSWQPLTHPVGVAYSEWHNGWPQECSPGEVVCNATLHSSEDPFDGLGPGWYEYLEDVSGIDRRFLVGDKLMDWPTDVAMEGLWQIRMSTKDPATSTLHPSVQVVSVRIDNTPPSGPAGPSATPAQIAADPPLTVTGATFNGAAIPAIDCGKFPVGSIITGTYEIHDPGLTKPEQHFGWLSLDVIPDGPAGGAATDPTGRTFLVDALTNGAAGTWELDTSMMKPCGYVIRLTTRDRTIVSGGPGWLYSYDIGFCLEEAPPS